MKGLEMFLQTFDEPATFLLDDYPNAAAAYSLRYLSSAFIGNDVISVIRSSDNTELGFTPTEIIDGTLESWVGTGNNGFVRFWYDQSGNNNNLVENVIARMPYIVKNGVLCILNNKPSLQAIDNYKSFTSQRAFTLSSLFSVSVFNMTGNFGSFANLYLFAGSPFNQVYANDRFRYFSNFIPYDINYPIPPNQSLLTVQDDGANTTFYNNTAQSALFNISNNVTNRALNVFGNTNNGLQGNIQELVLYDSDQTVNRIGIQTNVKNYYGI